MAGTQYVIDFGLDLDVGVERAGFPMAAGLVTVTNPETGEGTPQWFTKLMPQDAIAFRVWNQTVSNRRARIVGFRATWVNPGRYNELSSPLADGASNPAVFAGDTLRTVDSSQAKSSVYAQNRGGWIFGYPELAPAPLGETFTFAGASASTGLYYLRARLDVVIDDRT
ncbi:MAG: hypothetical protein AAGE94_19100, partial [Acidobacteriota bacterium]